MDCPITCLGVSTVADLVTLLATATRTTVGRTGPDLTEPHQHDEHTQRCPLTCLNLSARVTNALNDNRPKPQTIGDLLRLTRSGQLGELRNIGRRSRSEIHTALVAAGFDIHPSKPT